MEKKKRERPAFNRDIAAAMKQHYSDTRTQKPLAHTLMSSNPLIEVAYAAGIQPAFPENYACVCAARHASSAYCTKAEGPTLYPGHMLLLPKQPGLHPCGPYGNRPTAASGKRISSC